MAPIANQVDLGKISQPYPTSLNGFLESKLGRDEARKMSESLAKIYGSGDKTKPV